jgi:tyrosine-protein kinase Etk/Wzc
MMSTPANTDETGTPTTSHVVYGDDPDEINLLDLFIALAKHKALVLGVPLVVAVVVAVYTSFLPPTYTATTTLFPPQGQATTSSIIAQLGGLGGLAPRGKDPSDIYVAMLRSRKIADNLIQRFDLMKLSKANRASEVRERLAGLTTVTPGKDGIITIEVTAEDPKFAAALANAYVEELQKFTSVIAITEASQRRLFFERQFAQARDNLAVAEAAARQSLQKGGLVQVEGQSKAMVDNIARLRAQITMKEVEIGAMRAFATTQNPSLLAAQRELETMRQELTKLEGGGPTMVEDNRVDSRGMDTVRKLRNVKYYETLYELLAKQYEAAKLDESRDSGIVQVLDPAIEPDHKSGPKRRQMVLLWTSVTAILVVLWVFMKELVMRSGASGDQSRRLQTLRNYLRFRSNRA